jgi:hypothetical protein
MYNYVFWEIKWIQRQERYQKKISSNWEIKENARHFK